MTSRFSAPIPSAFRNAREGRTGARRHMFAALASGLATLASLSPAAAACLADTREINLGGENAVRTAQYVCGYGEDADQKLRVEFHRLSDVAAGAILAGQTPEALKPILGDPRLIKNEAGDAYRSLLDRFGTTIESDHIVLNVEAPQKGQSLEGSVTTSMTPSLHKRFSSDLDLAFELASPSDFDVIHNTNRWPERINFFYHETDATALDLAAEAVTLWKYVTRKDIDDFAKDWKAINRIYGEEQYVTDNKYRDLIALLTENFWPPDLLIGNGGVGQGCDPGLIMRVNARPVLLEIAVIENMSGEAVRIANFFGGARNEDKLRPPLAKGQDGAGPNAFPEALEIAPGERVTVPLKIVLAPPPTDYLFGYPAPQIHALFKNAPEGTVVQLKGSGERPIQKAASSFKAQSKPTFKTYAYGPEIDLAGLDVNGATVLFEERSANFLELTGQNEGGSCPVLYVWRDSVKDWARRGKVIHDAKGSANAMTERVNFMGLVTRFRLTEEEFERALIDRVVLVLMLKDGREIWLKPNVPEMAEADGAHQKIVAGQVVEFSFDPPEDTAPVSVERSSLVISGYYERYSDLQLTAN